MRRSKRLRRSRSLAARVAKRRPSASAPHVIRNGSMLGTSSPSNFSARQKPGAGWLLAPNRQRFGASTAGGLGLRKSWPARLGVRTLNRLAENDGKERAERKACGAAVEGKIKANRSLLPSVCLHVVFRTIGLIIDGIDGRVHHVAFCDAAAIEEARIGAIVEVGRTPSQRPADRNIVIVATGTGVYRPSAHRKMLEAASARVRGGDRLGPRRL